MRVHEDTDHILNTCIFNIHIRHTETYRVIGAAREVGEGDMRGMAACTGARAAKGPAHR